jgi:hypothetical protein
MILVLRSHRAYARKSETRRGAKPRASHDVQTLTISSLDLEHFQYHGLGTDIGYEGE